jgi:hypothetical protein
MGNGAHAPIGALVFFVFNYLLIFLYCFDTVILKINLKNKKYYFSIFLIKNTII